MSHHLTPDAYDAKRARVVHLWETEPDLARRDIAERLDVDPKFVASALRDADKARLLKRPLKEPSTRASRTGRPTSGAGRATDGGWLR
jgi:hypothetical protein